LDDASNQTDGTLALINYAEQLDVYAKQLGVKVEEAKDPLNTKSPLEHRLKVCKIKLQAMVPIFDQEEVSPRDFNPYSISYFERLLRQEILKTIREIPEDEANNYLGVIEAVEHNVLEAKNVLNDALDELEKAEDGGSKRKFYDLLDKCAECLRRILKKWDVPQPPNKQKDVIAQ
jgi:hypothetical protein